MQESLCVYIMVVLCTTESWCTYGHFFPQKFSRKIDFLALFRIESVASEHISFISFRITQPRALITYFFVIGSQMDAFSGNFILTPSCYSFSEMFRRGVSL